MRGIRWFFLALCLAVVLSPWTPSALAEDPGWPRELLLNGGRAVLFQPQIEEFEGREIVARAAVSVTPTGATTPIFGAVWLQALIDKSKGKHRVMLRRI